MKNIATLIQTLTISVVTVALILIGNMFQNFPLIGRPLAVLFYVLGFAVGIIGGLLVYIVYKGETK